MFIKTIKDQIDCHDVISFDIFDTLLLRPYVNPNDMFKHMEKAYNLEGYANARISAERDAWNSFRTNEKEDITLDEIYSVIDEKFKEYIYLEKNFEKKISIRNQEIYEVYQYAINNNKKIIFASDMYLSVIDIKEMVERAGYTKYNKIYISSEYGKLKQTTSLYRFIIKDLGITSSKILHIGDNHISDVERSKEVGICGILYPSIINQYKMYTNRYEKFLSECNNNTASSVITMISAISYNRKKIIGKILAILIVEYQFILS